MSSCPISLLRTLLSTAPQHFGCFHIPFSSISWPLGTFRGEEDRKLGLSSWRLKVKRMTYILDFFHRCLRCVLCFSFFLSLLYMLLCYKTFLHDCGDDEKENTSNSHSCFMAAHDFHCVRLIILIILCCALISRSPEE